jgi:DNA-binding response OmpR family regulator
MKKTILLIDDCEMMRRFLAPIFKDKYEFVAVNSPMEAMIWLKANPTPDTILLDYEMPVMPGLEFLKHLRQMSDLVNVPVMMLSGVKDAERRWQCIEAGANDFLAKPFHPKELLLRVNLVNRNSLQPANLA